ncbi:metallophosphoesterase [Deinococcus aquiradiocola]|uniref:Phosphoprotein phosphatase n=1 Tax=Deinococcus aquiradiocola TaxID=393059 RepID=A0A917PI97_9DEIO|nr:metallophosphoesterase [Deinococcus aquiradiocola]GGJ79909.1 phosphoprotein phosphatase [Deinococcus aquiradiocola]
MSAPQGDVTAPRQVIAVPDLHGRSDLLRAAIEAFPEAHFLSLGDAIDRGPHSLDTISVLLELRAEGRATLLMGNHERMAWEGLKWYRQHQGTHDLGDYRRAMEGLAWWMKNGGESVRRELGGLTLERYPKLLAEYLDALERVVYVTEDGGIHSQLPAAPSVLVAHASPPVKHRDHPNPESAALWLRPFEGPFALPQGVVYSVHGHTPVRMPLRLGRHVYLDLGAYETGLLALLPLTVQTLSPVTVLAGRGDPARTNKYPMLGEPVSAHALNVRLDGSTRRM